MILNGVMALFCIISPNSVASEAHYVKMVEDVVVKKFTFAISSPGEFLVAVGINSKSFPGLYTSYKNPPPTLHPKFFFCDD